MPAIHVLLVCTANQCRSPMAEAMLRARLSERGVEGVEVSSAGELDAGVPATDTAVATVADRGLDLAAHRSRRLDANLVAGADLVLGLARRHVRHAVTLAPAAFPKTFTLKELVRRGRDVGPRRPEQSLADWLTSVSASRTPADLLGDDPTDDVADPIGRPRAAYERTADEIDALLQEVVALAFPS